MIALQQAAAWSARSFLNWLSLNERESLGKISQFHSQSIDSVLKVCSTVLCLQTLYPSQVYHRTALIEVSKEPARFIDVCNSARLRAKQSCQ